MPEVMNGTPLARVLGSVDWDAVTGPDSCWPWALSTRGKPGYGQVWMNGTVLVVHRVVADGMLMELLPGEVVHHRCGNPRCVNPRHLEVMDAGEHSRLHNPRATVCSRGHALTGRNAAPSRGTFVQCRTCKNERQRRRHAERRQGARS